jgi:asparagine synthase (glutamine-hydrolysing)
VRLDVPDVAEGLGNDMSGICAVWMKDHPERVPRVLGAVQAGLAATAAERSHHEVAQDAGVAVHGKGAGQQVFRNARLLLACDADLLNIAELASSAGVTPQPAGVATLLAALYEQQGEQFLEQLRGAFSLVLWDVTERRLLAAIDGFGIKRLAWYDDGRRLLIASRVDALRGGTDGLAINPRAIANIVNFSTNLAPETIFTNVQRLAPGTWLKASDRETRTVQYWDMRYGTGADANEARLSRELETVVERSVAAHCVDADGGLGGFLSGGTDSSTVIGMMTRAAGGPVKAFSIGFEEQRFNELQYAEIAARTFRSQHYTYLVRADDCVDALPDIIRCFDEPFCNSSAIPTYFCGRLAAQNGVTMLLSGDGGDELFGGNERYATDKIFQSYHYMPALLRKGLIEPVAAALPVQTGLGRRAQGYLRRANMPGVERLHSFQFLRVHPLADIFESDFLRSLGSYDILDIPSRHYNAAQARDHLDRLLYVDMKVTLADNDLPKVTCMSELAGITTRFPFLDRTVAEFSGRMPANLKVKGFQKRYLFKKAFRNLLPAEIIRKKKHGFGIPVAQWMKTDRRMRELAHDTLLSPRAFGRGYFRRKFVEEWFRKHDASDSADYGEALWTLLIIELWHRHVVDQPASALACQ